MEMTREWASIAKAMVVEGAVKGWGMLVKGMLTCWAAGAEAIMWLKMAKSEPSTSPHLTPCHEEMKEWEIGGGGDRASSFRQEPPLLWVVPMLNFFLVDWCVFATPPLVCIKFDFFFVVDWFAVITHDSNGTSASNQTHPARWMVQWQDGARWGMVTGWVRQWCGVVMRWQDSCKWWAWEWKREQGWLMADHQSRWQGHPARSHEAASGGLGQQGRAWWWCS